MQIGIDSFVETTLNPGNGSAPDQARRVRDLLEEIELADQVGLDVFGIGEHHRQEFVASAPAVILAAAAARTKQIRLTSAVTVLSSEDPVRVFQQFATLDLISQGRAEIIVGRGSFIESYPLFGFDLEDYDVLFTEKLELLLKIRDHTQVRWSGKHRAALTGQGVYPRPIQDLLPIRVGVGGTPESFARAGKLGLPLVVAIIGGEPRRFRPLVDYYRESARQAGHTGNNLEVDIHSIGFIADTSAQAADDFYPSYSELFNRIGKTGWPPITRAQFDAGRGPTGALLVGDPESIAEKIVYENNVLGGISSMSILLNGGIIRIARRCMRSSFWEPAWLRTAIVRKELALPIRPLASSNADLQQSSKTNLTSTCRSSTGEILLDGEGARLRTASSCSAHRQEFRDRMAAAMVHCVSPRSRGRCGVRPMMSATGRDKVASLVNGAVNEGARLAVGGHSRRAGFFYPATVLVDVPAGAGILREEILAGGAARRLRH